MSAKFTPEQLADWVKYEEVRNSGRLNMFDDRARALARLSRKRYFFALTHYDELKAEHEALTKEQS